MKKIKDHFLTKETFGLEYDLRHKMYRTVPKPPETMMGSYYKKDDYFSHKSRPATLFEKVFFFFKKVMLAKKLKIIKKLFPKPLTSLDIGSGTGDFVLTLAMSGWESFGIEPFVSARLKAENKGVKHLSSMFEAKDGEFDLVTFWHSFEHVYSLNETIQQVNRILKYDGILLIACPNFNSWDAKHYKEFWAGWDVPRHLRHFSLTSLKTVLEPKGYKQIDVKSLLLDAYYVSMLSEKIKGSRFYFIKGFLCGFVSNFLASFNKNYSSNIYIFKKQK